jgi:hypothetical protein
MGGDYQPVQRRVSFGFDQPPPFPLQNPAGKIRMSRQPNIYNLLAAAKSRPFENTSQIVAPLNGI